MITLGPQVVDTDIQGVYGIITLITDADACKKRLDLLLQTVADANALHADVDRMRVEAAAAQEAAEQATEDAKRMAAENSVTRSVNDRRAAEQTAASQAAFDSAKKIAQDTDARIASLNDDMAKRETALADRERKLTLQMQALEGTKASFEASSKQREADLDAREAAIEVVEKHQAAVQAELARVHDALNGAG